MDFYVFLLWGFQFLFCKSNFGYARKDWIFILVCFERMFIVVFAPAKLPVSWVLGSNQRFRYGFYPKLRGFSYSSTIWFQREFSSFA